ncbi:MarR family transcriptional regulator [Streptomyces sp. CB01249]|uniref:MarR family transcriptional regulator n=1 Tax=unclassified Streptomyces TaxID=2593676 RepID=UPI000377AF08|nr:MULTISPECIES: MarR family transcriptional regulator [unclassified Streptomyces]MYQ79425.1 MarR family transcriptional regulator [Streptomyces sp. SID4923]OKJ00131.1 MarR family transcriptional regulator [Streptomyces sp. CB01249]
MSEQGPELEIVHLLRKVTSAFGLRQAEFAARHGMHPTDVRALVCLLDAERAGTGVTAGRLGAELGLNSAGTTSLIDRLERLGHLTRTRDERDRRRVLLRVTPQAVELGWAAFGPAIGSAVALLREFDAREVAAVRRFLGGFLAAVSEEGEDGGAGSAC